MAPETPLPTLAPTAVAVQGNLGQPLAPTFTTAPTAAAPTSSPTSPPTPTETISPTVAATATADPVADSISATAELSPPADGQLTPTSQTEEQPTATPTPSSTAAPAPSETPTFAPTATNTPAPVLFPRPPENVWPTLPPYNQPVATSPRHGVAVALGGAADGAYGPAPYSWTYSWTSFVSPNPKEVQHVPMLAGNTRDALTPLDIVIERDGYTDHNYWLVFNECEHQGQCNASPAEAAQFYHDRVLDLLFTQGGDPDADIIIGGVNAHPCGILWLKNFVDYYEVTYGPLPHAGWHFHLYPEMRPGGWPNSCNGSWGFDDFLFSDVDAAFNLWKEHANNALAFVQEYGERDDEIWFTEVGCLNNGFHQVQAPICQADNFVHDYAIRVLGWLNGEGRWVTRYAWFTNWDTKYWVTTHLITDAPPGEQWQYSSLGYWYSQIVPAEAIPLPWP